MIRVLPVPHHPVERRDLPGGVRALVSPLLERRGFLAAFTERTGGVSSGPYRSLNLAPHVGDDPANVERNRRAVRSALGVEDISFSRQVHGTRVVTVGGGSSDVDDEEADGLQTSDVGRPVGVLVADCVPLALASEEGVAAVHVGWRGLAAGFVQRALGLIGEPASVTAAIGPSIGPCHYEVGGEVVHAVRAGTGGLERVAGDGPAPRLDLPGTVAAVLRAAGVTAVERSGLCTFCEKDRFFSHRREGTTGRQALVAMRL